jgi:uncharacterized double-CXXCG motif protein
MKKFYWIRENETSGHTGDLHATYPWGLPGVRCPTCGVTWSAGVEAYPSVDLSGLPNHHEYEEPRPEPFEEFARLREWVRPLVPPGTPLEPGTKFGPLTGTASGSFGQFFLQNPWTLYLRAETLAALQREGVQGLKGCPTRLRFRKKNPPELLELELHPHGRLHPECIPTDAPPTCTMCGRLAFRRPESLVLDAATLPAHTDLFRLVDFPTVILCTERFAEAARHLEQCDLILRELPLKG